VPPFTFAAIVLPLCFGNPHVLGEGATKKFRNFRGANCFCCAPPFYPQSNGKIERWHQSLKAECVRPGVPLSIEDARWLVERYVDYYNQVRLHSAIGYVTPRDKLEGREVQIFAERDRKLEEARRQRQLRRQPARGKLNIAGASLTGAKLIVPGETEVGSAGKEPRRG